MQDELRWSSSLLKANMTNESDDSEESDQSEGSEESDQSDEGDESDESDNDEITTPVKKNIEDATAAARNEGEL